ncbi:MAG: type-4 uracil-DNA glycosylase [Archaeoglobaceae archaeon]
MSESLDEIVEEILSCKKCHLWETNTNYVPGEGNPHSEVFFVGEAPGKEEDLQGRPFVGAAGKLLTQMIETVLNLRRKDVYIANILKCRPPDNRDPQPEEVEACSPYLVRQINAINPKVLVCMGKYAANFVFDMYGIDFPGISRVKGQLKEVNGMKIIAIYHPAAILYRPQLRESYEKDFGKIATLIKGNKRSSSTLMDFL